MMASTHCQLDGADRVDHALTINFIDGDHVTLMAVGALLPPVAACVNDIAFRLGDSGGVLEVVDTQPDVAAAFANLSADRDEHEADR